MGCVSGIGRSWDAWFTKLCAGMSKSHSNHAGTLLEQSAIISAEDTVDRPFVDSPSGCTEIPVAQKVAALPVIVVRG